MFTLEVRLDDLDLTGLEALDWRRSHGLPDGNRLYTQNWREVREGDRTVKVDEEFVRAWFPRDQYTQWVWVSASGLERDELGIGASDENYLVPCPSDEVVKTLYIEQRTRLFAWQALPLWKTLWYILTNRSPA